MKTISIIGLILGVIAVIALSMYITGKIKIGKDVKTGVSNDKIQKAAETVGVPKTIASKIAQAPDSAAAARSIGIEPVLATAIANGIAPVNARVAFSQSTTPIAQQIYWPGTGKPCKSGDSKVIGGIYNGYCREAIILDPTIGLTN